MTKKINISLEKTKEASHRYNSGPFQDLARRIFRYWISVPDMPPFTLEECMSCVRVGESYIVRVNEKIVASQYEALQKTQPYVRIEMLAGISLTEVQNALGSITGRYNDLCGQAFANPWRTVCGFEFLTFDPMKGPAYTKEDRERVEALCTPDATDENLNYFQVATDLKKAVEQVEKFCKSRKIKLELVGSSRAWTGKPSHSILLMHDDTLYFNPAHFQIDRRAR